MYDVRLKMFTINEYRYKNSKIWDIYFVFHNESQKNYRSTCVNYNTRKQVKRNYKIKFSIYFLKMFC